MKYHNLIGGTAHYVANELLAFLLVFTASLGRLGFEQVLMRDNISLKTAYLLLHTTFALFGRKAGDVMRRE